jgi:hypothetical protein
MGWAGISSGGAEGVANTRLGQIRPWCPELIEQLLWSPNFNCRSKHLCLWCFK